MKTAQPIRNKEKLEKFKNYYVKVKPMTRNYVLIAIGLNTALRISDILSLTWDDVYDSETKKCREHISIVEKKTGKTSQILINKKLKKVLRSYAAQFDKENRPKWLFYNSFKPENHISRMQAYRIIKEAANFCEFDDVISCHSLRKTFGYFAWKQGIQPVLLMNIYNHSSFSVTKRYLGIEQDDRDQIFNRIQL